MQGRRVTEGDREDTEKSSSRSALACPSFNLMRSSTRNCARAKSPQRSHTRIRSRLVSPRHPSSRTCELAWRFPLPRVFQSRGDGLRAVWGFASGRDSLLRRLRGDGAGRERWDADRKCRSSRRSATRCGTGRVSRARRGASKGDDDGRRHLTRSDRCGASSPATRTGVCGRVA
jgi:hypothetical protein